MAGRSPNRAEQSRAETNRAKGGTSLRAVSRRQDTELGRQTARKAAAVVSGGGGVGGNYGAAGAANDALERFVLLYNWLAAAVGAGGLSGALIWAACMCVVEAGCCKRLACCMCVTARDVSPGLALGRRAAAAAT